MQRVKTLKREFVEASVCLVLAAFALIASTYAWYVANNSVSAQTSTINATTNGFVLQIAGLEDGAQHGGEQKSLEARTTGAVLSPASSNDLSNWFMCRSFDNRGLVDSYSPITFNQASDSIPGTYSVGGKDYHAFIRSDYIVYTITETGTADVYLDSSDGGAVTITSKGAMEQAVKGSMRVAITTQAVGDDGKSATGPETLRVVYAFDNETGKGNDSAGIDGWTAIVPGNNSPSLVEATYPHIYGDMYTDQTGRNWAATKNGDNYIVSDGSEPIAKRVGYDGIVVHVYIWLEGTDSDCVNGNTVDENPSTYDVTVKFAGVATK